MQFHTLVWEGKTFLNSSAGLLQLNIILRHIWIACIPRWLEAITKILFLDNWLASIAEGIVGWYISFYIYMFIYIFTFCVCVVEDFPEGGRKNIFVRLFLTCYTPALFFKILFLNCIFMSKFDFLKWLITGSACLRFLS